MRIRDLLEEVTEAFFPSNIYCIVCGSLIDRSRTYSLCDECVTQMHWITGRTCSICGKALPDTYLGRDPDGRPVCYDCQMRSHDFTRGWSCLTYGLHEREVMMDIKYNGKGYIARKMGDVMFDRMEHLIETALSESMLPFDVVIPVPVSKKRLVKRGYNQSELMARQFIKRWKDFAREAETVTATGCDVARCLCPVLETHVLVRQKETTMLRSLNPEERRLALHDAEGGLQILDPAAPDGNRAGLLRMAGGPAEMRRALDPEVVKPRAVQMRVLADFQSEIDNHAGKLSLAVRQRRNGSPHRCLHPPKDLQPQRRRILSLSRSQFHLHLQHRQAPAMKMLQE